jgi:hypothetical protein
MEKMFLSRLPILSHQIVTPIHSHHTFTDTPVKKAHLHDEQEKMFSHARTTTHNNQPYA